MSKSTSYRELEMKVIQWAEARKIIPNSTVKAQAQKTLEECGELLEAATVLKTLIDTGIPSTSKIYQHWLGKYRDAVGDVLVTIINGCALADVDAVQCLGLAYDEIKDRKGTMNAQGIFVKEQPQTLALKVVGEAV